MITGYVWQTLHSEDEALITEVTVDGYRAAFTNCMSKHALSRLKAHIYSNTLITFSSTSDISTIATVLIFFHSVNSTKMSVAEVTNNLDNPNFKNFLSLKVRLESLRSRFIAFEICAKPTSAERATYGMPEGGICHGASQYIAGLEDSSTALNRSTVLSESSRMQKLYSTAMNPERMAVFELFSTKIHTAMSALGEEIKLETVKSLLAANSTTLGGFLKSNGVDIARLLVEARLKLQEDAIRAIPELAPLLDTESLYTGAVTDGADQIFRLLQTKIYNASVAKRTYLVLLNFTEEVTDADSLPRAHDVLIRVGTACTRDIKYMQFVDLQDTGIYQFNPERAGKEIATACPKGVEIVYSYFGDLAAHIFRSVDIKYKMV